MRKLFSNLCFGVAALVMLYTAVALGNYSATQGSGTTFGSIVNGGVHYVQQMICDATTPSQCAAVNSSGSVQVSAVGVAQGSTTSGQTGSLVMGAVTTAAPTYTTAQTSPASLDTAGNLRVSNLTALPAGANLVGKFGIDQTTPGTTNGVQVNAALPAGSNLIGKTGIDQTTPGTTNNVAVSYGSTAAVADPCRTVAKTYTPISITTATTTRIVAPTSAKKTYVCYLYLQNVAADNIAVVEGTGGTCGSGTAGVIGGTTAANGLNNAANSGQSLGNGGYSVAATAGTNVDLCLITSAATPLAGHIAWVQAP